MRWTSINTLLPIFAHIKENIVLKIWHITIEQKDSISWKLMLEKKRMPCWKECLVCHLAYTWWENHTFSVRTVTVLLPLRNGRAPNLSAAEWTKIKDYGTIGENTNVIKPFKWCLLWTVQVEKTITVKSSWPCNLWVYIFCECLDNMKEISVWTHTRHYR